MLLQKQSKLHSRYDHKPYTVQEVQGTQILATQGLKIRKRDAQYFKKLVRREPTNYDNIRNPKNIYPNDESFTFEDTASKPMLKRYETTTEPQSPTIPQNQTQH